MTRKQKEKLHNAFVCLSELGVISLVDDKIYKTSKKNFKSDYFVLLPTKYFEMITDEIEMMVLLTMLESRNYNVVVKNKKSVVGMMSEEFLADTANISVRTLQKYIKILEDKQIIYIYRREKGMTNVYGLYDDKLLIDEYGKTNSSTNYKDKKGNARRSVVQKYNAYCKNPDKYSEEAALLLYHQVQSYNNEMDELQIRQPGDDYIKRKKDLSVFGNLTIQP